jgi:hypothetical protein
MAAVALSLRLQRHLPCLNGLADRDQIIKRRKKAGLDGPLAAFLIIANTPLPSPEIFWWWSFGVGVRVKLSNKEVSLEDGKIDISELLTAMLERRFAKLITRCVLDSPAAGWRIFITCC